LTLYRAKEEMALPDDSERPSFERFVEEVEPRLSRALVARFGIDAGREATVDALVYGWRNWQRVSEMTNAAGYLYRVGVSSFRPPRTDHPLVEPVAWTEPWVEPNLEKGLACLSDLQRTAVVLHFSFAWTYGEIAELLDMSISTVRNHIDRGMQKLRSSLRVAVDG
jgi:DNA-directed RNA polymerase specialized sigma24 family protein